MILPDHKTKIVATIGPASKSPEIAPCDAVLVPTRGPKYGSGRGALESASLASGGGARGWSYAGVGVFLRRAPG